LQTLNIVWLAMTVTVLIDGVVNTIIRGRREINEAFALLPVILTAVAGATFLFVWVFYRMAVSGVALQTVSTTLDQLSVNQRLTLQGRVHSSIIVCCVLLEAPAIYGLVNTASAAPSPYLFEWLATGSLLGLVLFRLKGFPVLFDLMRKLEPSPSR